MARRVPPCYIWRDSLKEGFLVAVCTHDKYNDGLSPRDAVGLARIVGGLSSHEPGSHIEARPSMLFQPEDWDNHLILLGGPLGNQVTRSLTDNSLHKLRGSFVLRQEMLCDKRLLPGRNCLTPRYTPGLETNVAGVEVDYGYISVQPNPMNPSRKLHVLAGIKGWGTLAAATAFSRWECYETLNRVFEEHFGMPPEEVNQCQLIEVIVRAEVGQRGDCRYRNLEDVSIELVRIDGDDQTQWTRPQSDLHWGPKRALKRQLKTGKAYLSLAIDEQVAITELSGDAFGLRFDRSALTPRQLDRFDYDIESALGRREWRAGVKTISERFQQQLPNGFFQLLSRMQVLSPHTSRSWVRFVTPRDYLRAPFELLRTERDYLVLDYPAFRAISDALCTRSGLSRTFVSTLRRTGEPLRVLLVASDPVGDILEDITQEVEVIQEVLQTARTTLDIELELDVVWPDQATISEMAHRLPGSSYHVFHYAGHSGWDPDDPEKSGLLLRSGNRRAILSTSKLAAWLRDSELSLCFLSSCEGTRSDTDRKLLHYDFLGLADTLVQVGVPEVLGFRWVVSSEGAIRFAESFYRSLLLEEHYDTGQAVFSARTRIAEENRADLTWLSPILVSQK